MALTEKRIRDAKSDGKTRYIWDDTAPGLGLRVTAAGAKAFVVDYYVDGKRRRMTLGAVPGLGLAEARQRAAQTRQAALDGTDGLAERNKRREMPIVSEALKRFETEYLEHRRALGRLSDRTASEYRRQIVRHLLPSLGQLRVRDVTSDDISAMLAKAPRPDGKPGVAPLAPVSANRVLALASVFFRQCEKWQLRPQGSNPTHGIERSREEARDRTLSADEMSALGHALNAIEGEEGAVLAIRLAALTGLRISEVCHMRWGDIDMRSGTVVLPKTKTGRRTHSLPTPALQLLSAAPTVGDWVVPGRGLDTPMHRVTVGKVFKRACARAGIEGACLHDLRRTVMTQAASMGVSAHLLRDMMGHKTAAMADRYIRNAGEPVVELRERVGAGIAAQMTRNMNQV